MAMKKIVFSLFIVVLLVSCATNSSFDLHTSLQEEYLNSPYDTATLYAKGVEENSKPQSFDISWKESVGPYVVHLSSSREDFTYKTDNTYFSFDNLLLGEKYYYSVFDKNGKEIIKNKEFKTSFHAPRLINVQGVTNVRDIGGWMTESGKRVKQGLIYRSGRFNENNSKEPLITEEGKNIVINELKIKTELDLRKISDGENGGLEKSVIGDELKYISLPMKTGGNYLILNVDTLPRLFEILKDEDNYPIVYHCSIGTDRTGMVTFILNGLLGVSVDDLYRDYLFSNFGYITALRTKNAIKDYVLYMNRFKGNTLSERIESFLIENGVEENSINSFKTIMLGGENE